MSILENILVAVLCVGVFFLFVSIFFFIVIRPILNYEIKKKSHKIQWKCEKSIDRLDCKRYDLYYRTLPSELGKYTRIYGENYWIHVKKFDDTTFYNKEQFIDFVKPFQTRKELEDYLDGESGWIYP